MEDVERFFEWTKTARAWRSTREARDKGASRSPAVGGSPILTPFVFVPRQDRRQSRSRRSMSSIGTGYDQSTTTFSPDGRVFQVEYATKAVDISSTAVGIRCKDGVVMCVEKPKLSKMLVEGTNRRIMTVDKHSGICISGMIADARQIVNYGRREATGYLDFSGSPIPGSVLASRISMMMHTYTLYWCAGLHRTGLPAPPSLLLARARTDRAA